MEKCKFSPNEVCAPLACLLRSTVAEPAGDRLIEMTSGNVEGLVENDDNRDLFDFNRMAEYIADIACEARNCAYEKLCAIKESQRDDA